MKNSLSSGNPVVDALEQINLEGNITPHSWYRHPSLQTKARKPNLVAIVLLSDIVYWYRPTVIRDDEENIIGYKTKFYHHKLYKVYEQWAAEFGFTKRQVQAAVSFLDKRGLIERTVKSFKLPNGPVVSTMVFLEPVAEKIKEITTDPRSQEQHEVADVSPSDASHKDGRGRTSKSASARKTKRATSRSNATRRASKSDPYTKTTAETSSETNNTPTADAVDVDDDKNDLSHSAPVTSSSKASKPPKRTASSKTSKNEPRLNGVNPLSGETSSAVVLDLIERLRRSAKDIGLELSEETARGVVMASPITGLSDAKLLDLMGVDHTELGFTSAIVGTPLKQMQADVPALRWLLFLWPQLKPEIEDTYQGTEKTPKIEGAFVKRWNRKEKPPEAWLQGLVKNEEQRRRFERNAEEQRLFQEKEAKAALVMNTLNINQKKKMWIEARRQADEEFARGPHQKKDWLRRRAEVELLLNEEYIEQLRALYPD